VKKSYTRQGNHDRNLNSTRSYKAAKTKVIQKAEADGRRPKDPGF